MNARDRAIKAINEADGPARYDGNFAMEAIESAGLRVVDESAPIFRRSQLIGRTYSVLTGARVIRRGNGLLSLWRGPGAPEAEEVARLVVNALWDMGAFRTEPEETP